MTTLTKKDEAESVGPSGAPSARSPEERAEHLLAEKRGIGRGIEEAAQAAAAFSVKADRQLHPDIPWEQMSETAQTVAHMTAQSIAHDIRALSGTRGTEGDAPMSDHSTAALAVSLIREAMLPGNGCRAQRYLEQALLTLKSPCDTAAPLASELRDAATALIGFIKQRHPEDFAPDAPGFTCPHMRRLETALARYAPEVPHGK